jgi:hypothetical protein
MELYKNMLAVETGWLFEEGIVSKSNYDQLSARGNIHILRRGCLNTPALVSWESLPERFKKTATVKLGDRNPDNIVQTGLVESCIQHSASLTDSFETHKLGDGRNLPKRTRNEYYVNAIVLEAIGRLLENKRARRASMGKRLKINWTELAEGVQELDRSKYPHTLPANPRRLEDKYKRYRAEGAVSLIHKNFLNINAAKVDDDIKASVLTELLADPRNLDNSQIASLYND